MASPTSFDLHIVVSESLVDALSVEEGVSHWKIYSRLQKELTRFASDFLEQEFLTARAKNEEKAKHG